MLWSHKPQSVSISVLESETNVFDKSLYMSLAIRNDLIRISSHDIIFIMIKQSLCLFEFITKATKTSERGLMTD